jgi:hypothetical protein
MIMHIVATLCSLTGTCMRDLGRATLWHVHVVITCVTFYNVFDVKVIATL